MKKLILILGIICTVNLAVGQEKPLDYIDKVQTIEGTIETLYSVISGEKGEERNWELFKYLFKPEAKLIPSGKKKEGGFAVRYMTPQDYIDGSGKWLVENGFHEIGMHNEIHSFGQIAQVFSSYESFRSKHDEKPFMRGINSIQLFNDGERWWVINIYWSQESPENPIPEQFLQKK